VIDFELTDRDVNVDDRWTYVWSARRHPFLHPLRTPSGLVLTRDAPPDHPWHHGLWFTVKFVNGENFWEEYDQYGVLRHDGPPAVDVDGGAVKVVGKVQWIRPDRETVVIDEDRTLTHRALANDSYAVDLDTTLTPRVDVVLDRTPFTTWGGYGGLTLRGSEQWSGTRLLLAEGGSHQQVHGIPARWCDLSNAGGGVAFFDHPTNPRHPVPWYGSTRAESYGDGWANFVNAAFLWGGAMALAAEEPLRLRHRVLVHDQQWTADTIDRQYEAFAG
jgi:hypothetical protein